MTLGRCATCKYWRRDGVWADAVRRPCEKTVVKQGEPVHPDSAAIASSNDDWYAELRTTAEFGCTEYEAR